ncbi:MAG TPA: hypothetical protein VFE78_20385 [Gemmataceae bacterium]|nr:hypothetical protein [Gemmataceae bacterium]
MWVPPGGVADMSGRANASLKEALTRQDGWVEFPQGGCSCTFGRCTRLAPAEGDHDWYEPCEPALERDGLPWFYFIPSVEMLAPELHERYLRESRELWGDEPGQA